MRHLFASALAISLLAGSLSPAHADSRGDRDSRHERHQDNRGHDRGRAHDHHGRDRRVDSRRDYRSDNRHSDNRHWDNRHWDSRRGDRYFDGRDYGRRYYDDRRFYSSYRPAYRYGYSHPKRFYGGAYYRPYGYRYYSWRRGDYLPGAYYAPRYIVRDYRAYRLYAPPRGYRWVRVDNDVVLAAIASGLVVGVVSNLFY